MRKLFLLLVVPSALVVAQSKSFDPYARIGFESITPNDLSAHLHFIASPELEGRETTFRGQKIAARYIASVFQKLGLKPIGDDQSYFQRFDLEVTRISEHSNIAVTTRKGPKSFTIRRDFLTQSTRDTIYQAPVVFVGYMDATLDSAAQALIKGKIVVAFGGRKGDSKDTSISAARRVSFSRSFPGSVATMVVADDSGSGSIDRLYARFSRAMEKTSMRLPGAQTRGGFSFPPVYYISPPLAGELLKEFGKSLDDVRRKAQGGRDIKPTTLKQASVRIESKLSREVRQSENVIGLLEGSDPAVKDEVVLFTAHYDHEGIGADGIIFHGADDDGSGTVAVLELAEAFATNPVRPRRSVAFMTVTGEEKGLLGSEYYVKHPIIPLDKTVADLNIDMIGRTDKKHDELKVQDYVYVIGSDKISIELDSLLKTSNNESEALSLDYLYNDENNPDGFYYRSDHYNFARNGIPVIFFFTGVHVDYHRPTDTVDKIQFSKMAKITRLIFYTGWKVANKTHRLVTNTPAAAR